MDAETKPEDDSDTKTVETQRKMNLQPRVPQLVSMVRSWNREHFRHFPCHPSDPAAARADRSKLLFNLLSNKRIIEGKVTIGETGTEITLFSPKNTFCFCSNVRDVCCTSRRTGHCSHHYGCTAGHCTDVLYCNASRWFAGLCQARRVRRDFFRISAFVPSASLFST